VYPTDVTWFNFLSQQPGIDEVNFWQPGGGNVFKRLQPGELFLFRLKSPINMIAGGGVFFHGSIYPLNAAWDAFGIKNGTSDFVQFANLIARYKGLASYRELHNDAQIGCIILQAPFFLPRAQWIPVPSDYSSNLVQGKRYDATHGTGRDLYDTITALLATMPAAKIGEPVSPPMFGDPVLTRRRLGQGAFRVLITDIYSRRCAITGEKTLPVLEAAHVIPVSRGGEHRPENGLLLRSDLHKLFDLGYLTIDEGHQLRVSRKLRDEWSNGRVYYDLDRSVVRMPVDVELRPTREILQWHNDVVFRQ
jgi:putative restriction endonuclease